MNKEKETAKTNGTANGEGANNNNNGNAEKIAQLLKVAAEKGNAAREKYATDAQKTDAVVNCFQKLVSLLFETTFRQSKD